MEIFEFSKSEFRLVKWYSMSSPDLFTSASISSRTSMTIPPFSFAFCFTSA